MALKSVAFLLSLNLLFFTMVSSNYVLVPSSGANCPMDVLKLGVCVNVLNLADVKVGSPPTPPCCTLIQGLVDLEATACLCTALKANVLGIRLNIPVDLNRILNSCGRNSGFLCA